MMSSSTRAPIRRFPASVSSAAVLGGWGRAGTPTTVVWAGTSWVTTDPAPVTPPSPMVTGARRMVSEPMNAPSPMTVRCLAWPS